MKIARDELLKILEISKMAVAGSDHLEQLGHFIFGGENLITFNNRLLIYYPFQTDFQCSVDSDLFFKQLQKYTTEEIEIELKKNRLHINGTLEKAKLAIQLEQDKEIFNIIDSIREEQLNVEYVDVPEDFVQGIDLCSYSASKNAADGTLCCICISGTTIMSCDNYRATQYTLDAPMSDRDLLLDARIANEIKRFKMIKFGIGENWLHFKNEIGVVLSARQIFGDYMDISDAFELQGKKMKLPTETPAVLDFVSPVIANEQQPERKANIDIKNGYLTASVVRKRATVEKSVPLNEMFKDLDMSFIINVDFLKSIIDISKVMVYDLDSGRAMFQSAKFKHCIRMMPEVITPEQAKEAVETSGETDGMPF